jgi:hypothetical protein
LSSSTLVATDEVAGSIDDDRSWVFVAMDVDTNSLPDAAPCIGPHRFRPPDGRQTGSLCSPGGCRSPVSSRTLMTRVPLPAGDGSAP